MNILIMKLFVNNNTSLDCLHSKDAVLHARLNLPESMLQCWLLKWYGRALPNWVLTFPKLVSLPCPQLSVTPDHQELKASTLRWHHNLVWAFISSWLIGPLHFPYSLQSGPNSSLGIHYCHSDWMNWFSMLGNRSPKG